MGMSSYESLHYTGARGSFATCDPAAAVEERTLSNDKRGAPVSTVYAYLYS